MYRHVYIDARGTTVPFVKAVIEPMKGRGPQRATTPFSHLRAAAAAAAAAARGRDNGENAKWRPFSVEFNDEPSSFLSFLFRPRNSPRCNPLARDVVSENERGYSTLELILCRQLFLSAGAYSTKDFVELCTRGRTCCRGADD